MKNKFVVTFLSKIFVMPRYVIEREIPGAGRLTTDELRAISKRSNAVIEELGPSIQWVESYVTEDKIYCIYNASDKEILKKHAQMGGFPANRIEQVRETINPVTGK